MREKYIEEVSETIARSICPIYREDCDEYQPHTCAKCFIFSTPIGCLAEDLYNAGYRKQSVGEWVVTYKHGFWHYDCPFCGDGYAQEGKLPISNYCSNCGAKMKGGA